MYTQFINIHVTDKIITKAISIQSWKLFNFAGFSMFTWFEIEQFYIDNAGHPHFIEQLYSLYVSS